MAYLVRDRYIGRSLELYGEFSEAEVVLFRHLLKRGDTVLEIGANIGAHTVPLAQTVGPEGQVLAFEPQRMIYYLLCANVVLNNLANVICHQAAVGDVTGNLRVPDLDYSGDGNFGGIELGTESTLGSYEVPVVRIDDLRLARCDLIKVDVEGMEKQVLEGARQTIARFKPLLYVEDDRREKSRELHDFLTDLGYEVHPHLPRLYAADNFEKNPTNVFGNFTSRNLLCWRRESAVAFPDQGLGSQKLREPFSLACMNEGISLGERGLVDEAAAWFRQALHWQPDLADAYHNLAVMLEKQGRFEEAATNYVRTLETQPDHAEALKGLSYVGNLQNARNDLDAAIACYRQVLRFQPDSGLAHNNLGAALLSQGRLEEAASSFQEAARLNDRSAAQNLAIVQGMLKTKA